MQGIFADEQLNDSQLHLARSRISGGATFLSSKDDNLRMCHFLALSRAHQHFDTLNIFVEASVDTGGDLYFSHYILKTGSYKLNHLM